MRVGLFGTEMKDDFREAITELLARLESDAEKIIIQSDYAQLLEQSDIKLPEHSRFVDYSEVHGAMDVMLSIGGDGTFLKTVTYVRDSGIPILGINTGRLGFLAYVAVDRIQRSMGALFAEKFSVKQRSMLQVNTGDDTLGEMNYALNEIAVHKKDSSSMVIIHLEVDGKFLTSYWADGLIISTPTGSTAYNLSCGGPIVAPNTPCLIITPKAPHNLSVRPLVVHDDVKIKMRVECRDDQFLLSLDSRSYSMENEAEIQINKSDFDLNIIRPAGSYFFKTIRRKLKWGLDSRNR